MTKPSTEDSVFPDGAVHRDRWSPEGRSTETDGLMEGGPETYGLLKGCTQRQMVSWRAVHRDRWSPEGPSTDTDGLMEGRPQRQRSAGGALLMEPGCLLTGSFSEDEGLLEKHP